jgi:hypothetical protein
MCEHYGGEHVYKRVITKGYLNARYKPEGSNSMLHGVSRQAIKDLINRRVLFFESIHPNEDRYYRYSLEPKGHPDCNWYSQWYELQNMLEVEGLDSSLCLAQNGIIELKSEYEIKSTSNHYTSRTARTFIVSRKNEETIAEYTSYILYDPLNFVSGIAGVCPNLINSNDIISLPERVFEKW